MSATKRHLYTTVPASTGLVLIGMAGLLAGAQAQATAPPERPAMAQAARHSPLWSAPPETRAESRELMARMLDSSSSGGLFYGPRIARENWSALLDRLASDPSLNQWLAQEKTRVDAWMARRFERADLIGGWINDYIDPRTGLAKSWQPNDPEPPAGVSEAERKFKAAWVARGRDYNIAQMQAAARLYRATGEIRYAEWAAAQLDFYAQQYTRWPVSTAEGRSTMYRQGLDEAVASAQLVDTARLLDAYAGSARAASWRQQLFMPMAANLKSTSAPLSNIQLWHASAIAIIAMRYKDVALLDYAINDAGGIRANLNAGVTADHLWVEGTFSYNSYVIDCLARLLVAAGLEGYADRFKPEADAALRMALAPLEYPFDNGSLPNPGDSTSAQPPVNELAHWYLFRTMPTYWGVAKASAWRTWESLLDPPTQRGGRPPPLPKAVTRHFESLRWAVLRAGNWQAFVRYGAMHGNHAPEEMLNFELHEGRTAIAYDPGTTSYGSPVHQGYFVRGAAANAPLVDGQGQTKWAPGTLIGFDAPSASLTAEQARFQPDAAVRRAFRLTTKGFVEQSSLHVPSGKPRRLGMAFSSTCEMEPGAGTAVATGLPALPAVSAFGYWSQVSTFQASANWQLTLKCPGNKNYVMTVWGPPGQRLYLGKAPNTPMPATRNSLYYEVTGSSAVFESSITPP